MVRYATLQVSCNECEPRINTVGSGAINVGRKPRLESMIVGLDECSIASRAFN